MNIFLEEHFNLLNHLIRDKVKFLIIGGYAVNYYGYNRTTADLDLWLKPAQENYIKLANVLKTLNFSEKSLEKIMKVKPGKLMVFNIWQVPYRVDFLSHISGISFSDAIMNKTVEKIGDLEFPFISLPHLVISKISSQRLRDQADVEELQKISKLKK